MTFVTSVLCLKMAVNLKFWIFTNVSLLFCLYFYFYIILLQQSHSHSMSQNVYTHLVECLHLPCQLKWESDSATQFHILVRIIFLVLMFCASHRYFTGVGPGLRMWEGLGLRTRVALELRAVLLLIWVMENWPSDIPSTKSVIKGYFKCKMQYLFVCNCHAFCIGGQH